MYCYSDNEINAQQYQKKLALLLNQVQQNLALNETEIESIEPIFNKYIADQDKYETEENQALMSLIFNDKVSIKSFKDFAKILNRWNRTLISYHTLLKKDSPQEISLIQIQNGSIDVIFNIDLDIAIDLTELIKTGLKAYGAYLVYKSRLAKEIVDSYMGNKKLIQSEKEREQLLLDNIEESMKQKALEQHNERLNSDNPPVKASANKKAESVAKVVTDHIVKGNEIKLLTPPPNDNEQNVSTELRIETSKVRENWKRLKEEDKQLLLQTYTIKDDEEKK